MILNEATQAAKRQLVSAQGVRRLPRDGVTQAGGQLDSQRQEAVRHGYRKILAEADAHCPPPDESLRKPGQRGRLKRSESRNLLERLRDYEDEALRFMTRYDIPYTNNRTENDLRMTKVQKKSPAAFVLIAALIYFAVSADTYRHAANRGCQPMIHSNLH